MMAAYNTHTATTSNMYITGKADPTVLPVTKKALKAQRKEAQNAMMSAIIRERAAAQRAKIVEDIQDVDFSE
jgi:hypothetical protein